MNIPVGTVFKASAKMAKAYGVTESTFSITADSDPHEYLCASDDPTFRGALNKGILQEWIRDGEVVELVK